MAIDPDTFYPLSGRVSFDSPARKLCAVCPVILECRKYAWDNGESWGIWGGMTLEERYRWAMDLGLVRPTLKPMEPWTAKTTNNLGKAKAK